MDVRELLIELFGRIPDEIHTAVDGLSAAELAWAPAPGANTIGWLVWHLTRVQDDHVAGLLGSEQVWASGPWADRFGLERDRHDTGYGHRPAQVASVRPDGPATLIEYYEAVAARTGELLAGLTVVDLDRVVDERWDPPVTPGVRLVSIADDDIQHAGQAAYVRGLLRR
jgi:DinB superfamily